MIEAFNIRVYGLLIHNDQLLIVREKFNGEWIDKFPGGGLEFGEGLRQCLEREFLEELNLTIQVKKHLYTQEELIVSALNPKEQVLMIYYQVETDSLDEFKVNESGIDAVEWKNILALVPEDVTMPTEQKAVKALLAQLQ